MQSYGAQLRRVYLRNVPAHRLTEHFGIEGKDCKSQRMWGFAVRLFPPVMSEAILIKSHQHSSPSMS